MSETIMSNTYSEEELKKLHSHLYDILAEFVRICDELGIEYFLLGGSIIGAYYWKGIIPFDDDIDVGMTRHNYERFIHEAPQLLDHHFFLQSFASEPHTPYYFAKLRRNDTEFIEETTHNTPIHQGIFIDIMPLDKLPEKPLWRYLQRKLANTLNDCFVAKEIWRYKHLGGCEIEKAIPHSWFNCLINKTTKLFVPKRWIFYALRFVQTAWNKTNATYYNTIPPCCDLISAEDVAHLIRVPFGPLTVFVMENMETYLHHHYPTLKKHLSKAEIARYSHRPQKLTFVEQE